MRGIILLGLYTLNNNCCIVQTVKNIRYKARKERGVLCYVFRVYLDVAWKNRVFYGDAWDEEFLS